MKVELLRFTENPDLTAALAAKACYSSAIDFGKLNLSANEIERLIKDIIRSGHYSVLEHVVFTFGIYGVSRVLTHQLVRHRLASYSQQSLRYTKIKSEQFTVPPSISSDQKALETFNNVVEKSVEAYEKLISLGIKKEDARFVIPQAVNSNIVTTMNARELLHFFTLRTCVRAQWEIQNLAMDMLRIVKGISPLIFNKAGPSCIRDRCHEKKPCKDIPDIRKRFDNL